MTIAPTPTPTPIRFHGALLDHAFRERRDEHGLRCQRVAGPSEPIGRIEHNQNRRDDNRAEDDADNERNLLPPRRRADELTGFEILEVDVRNRGNVEHDGRNEKRKRDQRRRRRRIGIAMSSSKTETPTTGELPCPKPAYSTIRSIPPYSRTAATKSPAITM